MLGVALLLSGCACGGNETAVAKVQSLSSERFARLFDDVAAMPHADATYREDRIPAAFADLAPESITIRHGLGIVQLSGCVDDKVSLVVRGADGQGTPEIQLIPGEAQQARTLWTETSETADGRIH